MNKSDNKTQKIEFLGYTSYIKASSNVGNHPQFYHINCPPEGYEFAQEGKKILDKPKTYGYLIKLRRIISLIIPAVKLAIKAVRGGEKITNALFFVLSRIISQSYIPKNTALVFLPSFTFTLGQLPWVIEIEDVITLFTPPQLNGRTAGIKVEKMPFYHTVKTLIEDDNCKGVICHIKSTAESVPLLFKNSKLKNKIFHVPLGVCDIPELHKKERKQTENINILFTNSWHQGASNFYLRGGLDVLDAFSNLSEKHENIRLILRTKLPEDLEKRYKDIVNDKKVILMDKFLPEKDMKNILSDADIYVLPSARIHVVSLLQAMSYGTAIVVSDGWGFDEYVEDGRNALVVSGRYGKTSWMGEDGLLREDYKPMYSSDGKFVDELVKALSLLIENEDLRMKLGENARRDVECKFSINNWNKGLKKVFDQIVF